MTQAAGLQTTTTSVAQTTAQAAQAAAPPLIGPSQALAAAGPAAGADVSPHEFLNRDLSWLEFNRRVLHEALDGRTPLLERVRFLQIFTSNLDEYFMKRVGGLKRQVAGGGVAQTPDGLTPAQSLAAIRGAILPLLRQQAECYTRTICPALAAEGVHLLGWRDLTDAERRQADQYFRASVFPVLTPLAVDPGNPFPFISNLSTSLGVLLHHPEREENLFARIKIPEVLPQWVRVGDPPPGGQPTPQNPVRFVSLLSLIRNNLDDLFPDMALVDVMRFRVTRNADLERDEEDAEDLLELMEEEIRQRRFARVVRLEVGREPNAWMLAFLMRELNLQPEDVYEMAAEPDFEDLRAIADLPVPRLRYERWEPLTPPELADEDEDIFTAIRRGDVMVHTPYESFNASVERFVREACADPRVLAVKMTLYRTGDDSPFIPLLVRAAEANKQVVCLVELKARFDEERNINLANHLEKAGVHVLYGVPELKTHTKTTLVVRQDPDGIRCYAHVGTGNYHPGTAKLYTDFGLLTCDHEITRDLVELFHYLTGRSLKRDYRKLLVAPVNMQDRFLAMIDREIENQGKGKPAHIIAKMNSLEERKVVRALYKASQAGIRIDLIVRGFCTLKPGVPGLSENIRVVSVIGRFLEHSRVFYFRNGADDPVDGEFYIGSADWMYRNLLARVEAVVPIEGRALRERLWEVLQVMLNDPRQAWDMQPDGSYVQRTPGGGAGSGGAAANNGDASHGLGTQQYLMNLTRQRSAGVRPPEATIGR
jgi:polyphosphate kinase